MSCVAWYPTMYEPEKLFGPENEAMDDVAHYRDDDDNDDTELVETAIMAVFAGEDTIPGATTADAENLKACLADDDRVKDFMVKVSRLTVTNCSHLSHPLYT